jgi:hypothetical protein
MEIPNLFGNEKFDKALNIANRLWKRINDWKENRTHVILRNYKAECLIEFDMGDDANLCLTKT